jgi:hypothetical protein
MSDIVIALPSAAALVETRTRRVVVENFLDHPGNEAELGKTRVRIETVAETQSEDRSPIFVAGVPMRANLPPIEFDPASYLGLKVSREDGSSFVLGQFLADMGLVIDSIKGGLPAPDGGAGA